MNQNIKMIKEASEEYLIKEENEFFKDEVKKAIEEGLWEELSDRFYKDLEFGTGGMRGIIGGGSNRINPYTIRKATLGLADYIGKSGNSTDPSVVIAYDSRRFSRLFAEEAARVLCTKGIKVYLFYDLRPTPELSFAVRRLKATAGIVITASHNPPEYNGYKVYWSDGGQIVPPQDGEIIREVRAVSRVPESITLREGEKRGLLRYIGKEIDKEFQDLIKQYIPRPELLLKKGGEIKVIYTPLHGTGRLNIEKILADYGINVITVPEQGLPDGNFPTVKYPNPEEPEALALAVALAKKERATLVMATDPDADRLGVAVPDSGIEYRLLTGNQLGALLSHYLFSSLKEKDRLPNNPVFVKTIVTTELQSRIAESFGAKVYNVLTGFKYIAQKMAEFEKTGEFYVFGGEESYGYLIEREVRDKDAVSAAVVTVDLALYCVSRGITLLDYLDQIYSSYGYYEETLISKAFKGQQGMEKMRGIMNGLRHNPLSGLGEIEVSSFSDYLKGSTSFPPSDVLQYRLKDDTIFTIRPSGTEPKIKLYLSCWSAPGTPLEDAKKEVGRRVAVLKEAAEALLKD